MTLDQLESLGPVVPLYRTIRARQPLVPARIVLGWVRGGGDAETHTWEQYLCVRTIGHRYEQSGDDYRGEGRMLCRYCGHDGDA